MKKLFSSFDSLYIFGHIGKWTLLTLPVSLITGSLVALFLWLLEVVTHLQWQYDWLLYLLPIAGIVIYFLYALWGKNAAAGNNLIIEEIHTPGGGVPARMAPLVLITTLITHLFGGSAGREGTAVQMGGSMAAFTGRWYTRWFGLSPEDLRILLMTGIAAGFGAVFGTPIAGAIFALEVLAIGRIQYAALFPCLLAAVLGDVICSAWGIHHTHYIVQDHFTTGGLFNKQNAMLAGAALVAGIAFGWTGYAFAWLSHFIKQQGQRYFTNKKAWLNPVVGGVMIITLTIALGTRAYLGLGVQPETPGGISIVNAFTAGGVDAWSWWWKLLFTAITLGAGFKGGEVTPLFFIGAALGNTLATISGTPVDLMAALGFIAVFAAATNTPLACTLMGVELFGGNNVLFFAIACFTAYYFSGHTGIYSAQKIAIAKHKGAQGIAVVKQKGDDPDADPPAAL